MNQRFFLLGAVGTVLALILLTALPPAQARVDASFLIRDLSGRQIYMRDWNGTIIYGNVLVGQTIIFDAGRSNSMYPIDGYRWDFDGDGRYDVSTNASTVRHTYNEPGHYNVTLLATASSAPPKGDGDSITHTIIVVKKYKPPVASFTVQKHTTTETGQYMIYDASSSYDPDGYIKMVAWDFQGDGTIDRRERHL
ncbi:MAG: PKD domain-containing protein, partial [Thermoplasmatota archaeon]